MKAVIFPLITAAILLPSMAQAEFASDAQQAFRDNEAVQQAVKAQAEKQGLIPGPIVETLVSSSHIVGFAGTEGHQTYLVSQILTPKPHILHFEESSVSAFVTVNFNSTWLQTVVSEPEIYILEEMYLDTVDAPVLTTKQPTELVKAAVERGLEALTGDQIDAWTSRGFEVVDTQMNRLAVTSGFAGISTLYAASIHLVNPSHNGGEVVLFGLFYSDPIGDSIRGVILPQSSDRNPY